MARFSQQMLAGLLNPAYQQELTSAARGLGQTPAIMGLQREEKEKKQKLAEVYSTAMTPGTTSVQLFQTAQQLLALGNTEEAVALLAQARELQETEKAAEKETTQTKQESIKEGVLSAAYQAGLEEKPFEMLRGELSTFTSVPVGGKASDFIEQYQAGVEASKEPEKTFGTTITEWVKPDKPSEVILTTVQPKGSAFPIQLGTTTQITANDLTGLVKKPSKPAVSIDLGEKGETAYAKTISEGLADIDLSILQDGEAAEQTLSTIAETKLVLEESGDILGFGAKNISVAKSAMLSLMGALGVSETDNLYQKLNKQTAAANLYDMFTQEFVKVRMEATKGAITEREFDTFIASVPNLMQTEEGYISVLKTLERASTAAVLRANHVENNMGSRKSVKQAKDEWRSFSNQFTLGSLSNEAMTAAFKDFVKPGFSKDKMMFSYINENGDLVQSSYSDIARSARTKRLSPQLVLKRMFEDPDKETRYIPLTLPTFP
jgi:hypothetical protein